MKRIISIILSVIIILSSVSIFSFAYVSNNTYTASKETKKYVCTKATEKFNDDYNPFTQTTTFTYDAKGNIIKSKDKRKYDSGETIDIVIQNNYDSKGNLIKSSENYTNNKYPLDKETSTTSYTYDSQNRVTKCIETVNDKTVNSTTATYNSKGDISKLTVKSVPDDNSSYTSINSYSYNSDGLLSKIVNTESYKDENGTDKYTTTYSYSYTKGKVSKAVVVDEDTTTTYTYSYDDNNNLTKRSGTLKFSGYVSNYKIEYKYDANQRIKSEISSGVGYKDSLSISYNSVGNETLRTHERIEDDYNTVSSKTKYTYDKNNNLVKKEYSSFDYKTVTSNSYDSNGNIIKTTEKITDEGDTYTRSTTYTYKALDKAVCSFESRDGLDIKLSAYSYTYDGKAKKPAVWIKDMMQGIDYTVKYENNVKAGTAKAIINISDKEAITFPIVINFTIKPVTVTGLKQDKVTATTFTLSWNKLNNASFYKIEWSKDGGKTWNNNLELASSNSALIKPFKAGTKYQFRVTGLDKNKKAISKPSSVLKTQTLCSAPTFKLTSTKAKTANISITKTTGAVKYLIFTSTDNKKWTKIAETDKLSYTITKLNSNKKIYVKVQAVNSYKLKSAYSTVLSVKVK